MTRIPPGRSNVEATVNYSGSGSREALEIPKTTTPVIKADVSSDAEVEAVYAELGEQWPSLDIVVHSIAYAERDDLQGRFLDTSRDGFRTALEISAFSLVPVTRYAIPLMGESGGSVITMTYIASRNASPHSPAPVRSAK